MSSGSFKNVIYKISLTNHIYLIYKYEQDLSLDNLQWLIWHKIQPNQSDFLESLTIRCNLVSYSGHPFLGITLLCTIRILKASPIRWLSGVRKFIFLSLDHHQLKTHLMIVH